LYCKLAALPSQGHNLVLSCLNDTCAINTGISSTPGRTLVITSATAETLIIV
jgi:hypothetical protein